MAPWELKGRVVAEGRPAVGAHVTLWQFPAGEGTRKADVHLSTVCDAEGEFRFQVPRRGLASVTVRRTGFQLACASAEPGTPPLRLHLERGASVLAKFAGVELKSSVLVRFESDRGMWESGGRSEAAFDALPVGVYKIVVESGDVELAEPLELRVDSLRPYDVELRLRPRA